MIKRYLGDKAFWRSTFRLALPTAIQNLLISSFTLIDTVMVGQLGDISLAAVGMAGQYSFVINLFLFGISSGTSVFVSQYWGAGNNKGIKKILGITLVSSLLCSFVFLLSGLLFPEFIIGVFNKETAVISEGAAYLRTAVFSYPAIALAMSFSAVLRSTENVRIPMYASGISTVLNCIFNYVFIFGALGIPAMGIKGAALATTISAWINPLFMYFISYKQHNIIIGKLDEIFIFERSLVIEFIKKAAPVTFNEGTWGLGTLVLNIMFGRLGYEQFAAVTILRTFTDVSFAFFIGLCSACCVMVGKSIGQGKIEEGYTDSLRFTAIVPLFSLFLGMVILIFRSPLVKLFNLTGNLTPYTAAVATGIMAVVGAELFLRNIPYIQIVGIFRSGGDTFTGMKYDFICLWLFSIPVTYLTSFVLKIPFTAVYATMLIFEDVPKIVMCLRHFRSRKWIMPVTEEGKKALIEMQS
ncbi:MAG: MATE family efflux transporter [Clostridiales bacterium]|nr:MATE family efflux transporter [Clostridiales bacterium]